MPVGRLRRPTRVTLGETGIAILLVMILVMGAHPAPVGADAGGAEPGSSPPDAQEIIGNYTHEQQLHDLTPPHAQQLTHGLRVWAHPDAETLQVDPDYLENAIGPWSTNASFTVDHDGSIQLNQSSALFKPLELGPDSVFTQGSPDTIQFSERPMWANLTSQEDTLVLGLTDENTTGQAIFIAKKLLHDYGIHRPNATHENGTSLTVSPNAAETGYWIDVPHFSEIILTSEDIKVFGRQDGNTFAHEGAVAWNTTTDHLYINVGQQTENYSVLVEQAWFEANMPHVALVNHSWDLESHLNETYYRVNLTASDTPVTLDFMEYRVTQDLLYTYGHPDYLWAHPFNETLREERGPMWVQVFLEGGRIDIQIEVPGGGAYEVLAAQGWIQGNVSEHPVFTENGIDYPVQPGLGLGWVFQLLDELDLSIVDSADGPLVPPRYERVEDGILTHMNGCGIRHLVHVQNESLVHEGPACLNATVLKAMADAANETHWLYEGLPVSVCAVYYEEMESGESAFVGLPCAEPIGLLPGFVDELCNGSLLVNKSHDIFCSQGLSRHHAAGLLLNVTQQEGSVLSDVLYWNDHLVDWENTIRANTTLYQEEGWRGESWMFLHEIRWLEPCHVERPLLFFTPAMPGTVCGRTINEYEGQNGTVVLELGNLTQDWDFLLQEDPCGALETMVVLSGPMDPYCGQALPLVRNATNGFMDEVDWTSCADNRGFLGLGLGLNRTSGSVCGTVLPEPTGSTGDAWQNVRSLPACADEVSFVLHTGAAVPDWLCGEELAPNERTDVQHVFSYVDTRVPCGSEETLLIVGGDFGSPVVVCAELVGDLGGSWTEDWAEVSGSNPCGGEVGLVVSNVSMGRLCGNDYAVNQTAWRGVVDAVRGQHCLGSAEEMFLGLGSDDALVVCMDTLPDDAGTAEYWDEVLGAWNPCGSQSVWVPANQSAVLGEAVELCGVRVPDLAGLIGDFQDWESSQGLCGERLKVAVLYSFGESEVCGLGPDEGVQVEALLDDLESESPCGLGEAFVLGFGDVPFAVCGVEFVDLRGVFTELTDLLMGLQPCSLENLTGSEFCGLELPDYEAICDTEALSLGVCANHSYNQTVEDVPVGYPVVEEDSVLWFVGAPEFGFNATCVGWPCDALDVLRLRGGMSGMGGLDLDGVVWVLEQETQGVQEELDVLVPVWGMVVGNLLLPEEVEPPGPPARFEWLTQEVLDQLELEGEVPIDEIEGFPTDWTDDPSGDAPLPYMKIRPGSPLHREEFEFLDAHCTANFVFQHVDDLQRMAIGTAGHCFYNLNQTIYSLLVEEELELGQKFLRSVSVGQLIMSTGQDIGRGSELPLSGKGRDFGLIEIDSSIMNQIHPAIAVIDGPCGWRNTTATKHTEPTENVQDFDPILFYGHAQQPHIGKGGTPRTGFIHTDMESYVRFYRLPAGGGGDSGAPIRFLEMQDVSAMPAAAILTHGDYPWTSGIYFGGYERYPFGKGTSMNRIIELLEENDEQIVKWWDSEDAGSWSLVDSPNC